MSSFIARTNYLYLFWHYIIQPQLVYKWDTQTPIISDLSTYINDFTHDETWWDHGSEQFLFWEEKRYRVWIYWDDEHYTNKATLYKEYTKEQIEATQ